MIDIKEDPKSDAFILTQTDKEGFHRQMTLTWDELQQIARSTIELNRIINKNY